MVDTEVVKLDAARTGRPGRYFLAAWPDDSVRMHLAEWSDAIQTGSSARRVPASKLHITLVFLGTLEPVQLQAVRSAAMETRWTGATLTLDRIGYWKRSRIVWAGSRDGSAALTALAEQLRSRLRRSGFQVEERPFAPHVTLYRNARRRPRWRRQVIEWRIEEFCLVQSRRTPDGSEYEVLERWSAHGDME